MLAQCDAKSNLEAQNQRTKRMKKLSLKFGGTEVICPQVFELVIIVAVSDGYAYKKYASKLCVAALACRG